MEEYESFGELPKTLTALEFACGSFDSLPAFQLPNLTSLDIHTSSIAWTIGDVGEKTNGTTLSQRQDLVGELKRSFFFGAALKLERLVIRMPHIPQDALAMVNDELMPNLKMLDIGRVDGARDENLSTLPRRLLDLKISISGSNGSSTDHDEAFGYSKNALPLLPPLLTHLTAPIDILYSQSLEFVKQHCKYILDVQIGKK